jgi:hypothetical protein
MTQTTLHQYQVIRLHDDGEGFDVLTSYRTYESADASLDRWCNRFQNAWIEINKGTLRFG